MTQDSLVARLFNEIAKLPILDPHSHIDPFAPTAKSLDDLLGYHYYTELAHSAGMSHAPLQPKVEPRERCQEILKYAGRFDNSIQYQWLLEIARVFLDFPGDRLTEGDAIWLFDQSVNRMSESNWTNHVFKTTKLEKIFLTNSFDDQLDGFDRNIFIPCLRADDLVFGLHDPSVRNRLSATTGIEIRSIASVRKAIEKLFQRFKTADAKACAISLPPNFEPMLSVGELADSDMDLNQRFDASLFHQVGDAVISSKVFWMLSESCREFSMPFDLMIGVNRNVYREGVHQGRDLFDQRTSLIQYADLFNSFPSVTFCISVLTSNQNQELVSYAWIFPNVLPMGHWWYSNIPAFIEPDLRARLTAVPKTKLIGYYSDAYKLEFVLPKFNMYRRSLAKVLADEFVRPGRLNEDQAIELARIVVRDNVERVFLK